MRSLAGECIIPIVAPPPEKVMSRARPSGSQRASGSLPKAGSTARRIPTSRAVGRVAFSLANSKPRPGLFLLEATSAFRRARWRRAVESVRSGRPRAGVRAFRTARQAVGLRIARPETVEVALVVRTLVRIRRVEGVLGVAARWRPLRDRGLHQQR